MGTKIGGACLMLAKDCDIDDCLMVNAFLRVLNALDIPENNSHSFIQKLPTHIRFKHTKHFEYEDDFFR